MMSRLRRCIGCLLVTICVGSLLDAPPASGQGAETVGVITEIKAGRGRVEVKPAGTPAWRQARPLLALRAGDEVRATEDASVVILMSGGRGTARVDAKGSPWVVPAPQAGEGKAQKAQALLQASLNYLSSSAKEPPKAVLATRAGARPPLILSPRNSAVLPGSLTLEWLGSRFSHYAVRIAGPSGVVLERKGLTGAKFEYPPDAPPLSPGVRYTVQVVSGNHPAQEAWFEIVEPSRAEAIRRDLAALEQELGPMVSPNTLVTLRVGFLADNGLIHDARLSVLAALAKDPDEPTLHAVLGNLYAKGGLSELAAESYDEAEFLLTRGTK